jgi:hypothetical protein
VYCRKGKGSEWSLKNKRRERNRQRTMVWLCSQGLWSVYLLPLQLGRTWRWWPRQCPYSCCWINPSSLIQHVTPPNPGAWACWARCTAFSACPATTPTVLDLHLSRTPNVRTLQDWWKQWCPAPLHTTESEALCMEPESSDFLKGSGEFWWTVRTSTLHLTCHIWKQKPDLSCLLLGHHHLVLSLAHHL